MNIPTKALIMFLLIIAIIGGVYFMTMPYWADVQVSKELLNDARIKQEELKREQQQVETFLAEFTSRKELAKSTDVALPVKGASVENILSQLEGMAVNSGMALSDVVIVNKNDPSKKPQVNAIEEQAVTISASGTYPAFKNFLLLLEGNQRLIDIRDVQFDVTDTSIIEYKITFVTYYQN